MKRGEIYKTGSMAWVPLIPLLLEVPTLINNSYEILRSKSKIRNRSGKQQS